MSGSTVYHRHLQKVSPGRGQCLSKSRPKVQAGQRPEVSENKSLVCSPCSGSVYTVCLARANSKGLQEGRKAISGTDWVRKAPGNPIPPGFPSHRPTFPVHSSGKSIHWFHQPSCVPGCWCSLRRSEPTDFHLKQSTEWQVSCCTKEART